MICMLQNFIFYFYGAVVTHARVGPEASDLNPAELPDLEGSSRPIIAIVTVDSRPSLAQEPKPPTAFAIPLTFSMEKMRRSHKEA